MPVLMAAGIAWVGSFVELPPCYKIVSTVRQGRSGQAYNRGIQTSASESAICAGKTFGRGEEGFKVGLEVERAITLGGTVVEALGDSSSSRKGCREGKG